MAKKQMLVPPIGESVKLKNYAPDFTGKYDKETARLEEEQLEPRLTELQEMLWAQRSQSLLIILQGLDASGKDGTTKRVFDVVNPQGVRVVSFKQPSEKELSHDFLWRIHHKVPAKGYIGVFNRSHYEDVLVVRVNKLAEKSVWKKRYDHINNFERLLTDSGVRILKFFLHISKEEQKERFEERLNDPEKRWKFSKGDLEVRERWDEYQKAYEDVLTKCHTDYAPWHIVPADKKWYRNLVVTQAIVEELEAMDLAFPQPEEGLDNIVIPD